MSTRRGPYAPAPRLLPKQRVQLALGTDPGGQTILVLWVQLDLGIGKEWLAMGRVVA